MNFKNWIKKNKKILYWPIIAISYHIIAFILMQVVSEFRVLRMSSIQVWVTFFSFPFLAFHSLAAQVLDEIFSWINIDSIILLYVLYFVFLIIIVGSIFYGLGYLFNKIKKRWIKVIFIIFLIIFFLILIFFGAMTQVIRVA